MSEEEYTMEQLIADLESLHQAGLIEVKGIDPDGEWLYGLTEVGNLLVWELGKDPDKIKQLGEIMGEMGDSQGDYN